MRTAAIIAEYNPFHSGHAYQIARTRLMSGADYIIVIMSPDFVQRGESAAMDKYTRTRMALDGGADLVLELPTFAATGSAQYFARTAVRTLNALGCVDRLSFGCENPDITVLNAVSHIITAEPEEYQTALRSALAKGHSFPVARAQAITAYCQTHHVPDLSGEIAARVLSEPNNILAIEYLAALNLTESTIRPLPILRLGSYNSLTPDSQQGLASASALREMLRTRPETWRSEFARYIPTESLEALSDTTRADFLQRQTSYDKLLQFRLLQEPSYDKYFDISEDMSNRIARMLPSYRSAQQFTRLVQTRQVTEAYVRRALLHIFLGIEEKQVRTFLNEGAGYARILGFSRGARPLLHIMQQTSAIPLITKPADAQDRLDPVSFEMFEKDIYCSTMYQLLGTKSDEPIRSEYIHSPIIVH